MKKNMYGTIGLIAIIFTLIFTTIFSSQFAKAFQTNNFLNSSYYQIYKGNERIGNIKNLDDVRVELIKEYGDKINEDIYFGEDIHVEYIPFSEQKVQYTDVNDIMDDLDVRVDGVEVRTSEGKKFYVTSYRDWMAAVQETIQFIAKNDADKFNYDENVKGDIKVVESFYFDNQKIPIEKTLNKEEAKRKIIYENTDALQTDIILEGDTIESVAARNNLSPVQFSYANNVDEDALLVPGAKVNVTEADYALSFSYPIIEEIVEDIAFEIEYQDDPEKSKGEEEIIQQGINGKAKATYLVYIINGVSEPGERLEYEEISKPVKQIVKRGTKEVASSSSSDSAWSIGTDAPYANEAGLIWPAQGICISAEYGWYEYGRHNGIDIAGSNGEPIWAAAAGTVDFAGYNGAFGNHVSINHHNGVTTTYSHMSSIGVNKGQEVSQGTYVGGMGRTGFVDGTHLHFETHANGARLNPRGYLPAGGPASC